MGNKDVSENRRPYHYAELDLLHAAELLHQVKADSARLDLVHELQRHLIRCIVRTELRVLRLRRRRKSLPQKDDQRATKEQAQARKAGLRALREREEQLLHLLFLWRCFGDGIAFIYQSKYSLKHTYYDATYNVKAPAGFITEHGRLKRGFAREYRILCSGIKHNVPVVLCDLTNVIRYGDVCALGAEDPCLIEVKTSRNRNARTDRQAKLLQELTNFYVNDGASNFRGITNVLRVATMAEEVDHRSVLNACIEAGMRTGWNTATPEPGLTYLVCSVMDEARFKQHGTTPSTVVYFLSAQPDYLPSYPFTLSMEPANSVAFMQQAFGLVVFIDMKNVKASFARCGVEATVIMDGTHSVQITKTPHNLIMGVQRISEQMLGRVATEFLSIESFADEMSQMLDVELGPPMTLDEALALPGVATEVPREWNEVVDFWERK
ncbi:hypothetical protein [Bordetella genomosp. 12]|uniref:hypothetical protein n=1 Tax=Bordetella genomosp. 12 TaxID=463035 RepID=UPI001177EE16|nr:hypothetical protein [Bordetella genomosp. 12]